MADKNPAVFFPDLELVGAEHKLKGIRIDALAFDNKARAFVIIEYKKVLAPGVIEQVMAYRNMLNHHQNDCVMALNKKRADGKLVTPEEIDWQKTRMIVVGTSFTKHQLGLSNSVDQLELYEIHRYPKHLTVSKAAVTDKPTPPDPPGYSEDAWLDESNPLPQIRKLYYDLKEVLLHEFQLTHIQKKKWASFRLEGIEVCSVVCQKRKLRIVYSTSKQNLLPLNDFIHDVSNVGKLGNGHYRSDITTKTDISRSLEYIDRVCKDTSGSDRTDYVPPIPNPLLRSNSIPSEADWLAGKYGVKPLPEICDMYFYLKKTLLNRFHLEYVQKKKCASFCLKDGTQVCSIILYKQKLQIVYAVSKGDILLPSNSIRDISEVGHHGKGDYCSYVATKDEASRIMTHVHTVYQHVSRSGI